MKMRTAATAALVVLLGACSLAPEYRRPAVPEPAAYREAGTWRAAAPADAAPRGPWWSVFGDAELDALQRRVNVANQDLAAALARYQQARAAAAYARSGFLPEAVLGASSTRQQLSRNRAQYNANSPSLYTDNLLKVDVSYELDLWGRVRNQAAAASARAAASAADVAAARLTLQAELAADYFLLRGYDAEQALLEKTAAAYARALQLTRNRYRGGIAAEADVAQAETQWENARAQLLDTRLKRDQLEHAIAVLVGAAAGDFHLPPRPLATVPPPLPAGLPSALLERRPDIAAAERRVMAANADIGVARAAYFPVFELGAALGYESDRGSNWLTAPSRLWSVGPAAALTLFDNGARRAGTDAARAAHAEAVAVYRQSVLTAYREVEDNLAAQRLLDAESGHRAAALAAARRALFHADRRYRAGAVSYLEVVVAQNAELQAESAAVDVAVRRLTARVLLIKALGGGWQAGQPAAQSAVTPPDTAR